MKTIIVRTAGKNWAVNDTPLVSVSADKSMFERTYRSTDKGGRTKNMTESLRVISVFSLKTPGQKKPCDFMQDVQSGPIERIKPFSRNIANQ